MRPLLLTFVLMLAPLVGAVPNTESPYAGPEVCASCHAAEYDSQAKTRHFFALRPIVQSPVYQILTSNGVLPSSPAVTYRANGKAIVITAEQGIGQTPATLEWAFGAGAQGITPVGQLDGQYFEHRFSYFPKSKRLDVTFGHPEQPRGRVATLGVRQSGAVATRCFRCHSTGVEPGGDGPDLTYMIPGVSCERCHGPGRAHITAAKTARGTEQVRKALMNPGRLPPKAQIQVCGECHRLPPPGSPSPEPEIEDPVTVRFAPIGLMASRCFAGSGKLTCTSCHDPHRDALSRDGSSYSQVCLSCHDDAAEASGKCQRGARGNCLPCHMKQVQLTKNLLFTDHRIRVY